MQTERDTDGNIMIMSMISCIGEASGVDPEKAGKLFSKSGGKDWLVKFTMAATGEKLNNMLKKQDNK